MDFEKRRYLRQGIRCSNDADGSLLLTFEPRQGRYRPWWKQIEVIVHDRPRLSRVSSRAVSVRRAPDSTADGVDFYIPDIPNGGTITIGPA
jgi:alpha-glucosidase